MQVIYNLHAMEEYWTQFVEWLTELGEKHEVNPLLLGCLYLVSKVSMVTFLGFVVRNLRAKKPFVILLLCACVSFCVPYTYIIIAGKNIPFWVYGFMAVVFIYGGYTIWKTITKKQEQIDVIA